MWSIVVGLVFAAAVLTLGACATSEAPARSDVAMGVTNGNTARDGNVAIREEFDAAVAANTAAAYRLFIDRHPDHPLAADARRRLLALGVTE